MAKQQAILANIFEPETVPPEFMVELVAKLFAKFKDRYRGAMLTTGEVDWSKNKLIEWADYFTQKNATIDELRGAYVLCKDAYPTFPPNEVEFLALVRKNRHTDSHTALQIAVDTAGKIQSGNDVAWGNAVIYETAMRVGFYDLTHETGYILNNRWHKTYKEVCDEADNGAVFIVPAVPLLKIKKPSNEQYREYAEVGLANLQAMLQQARGEMA